MIFGFWNFGFGFWNLERGGFMNMDNLVIAAVIFFVVVSALLLVAMWYF